MPLKALALFALPLALLTAAPSGGALAQSAPQGRVCVTNDTVFHLTGFELLFYGDYGGPLAEKQSGIFPVAQTRCIDIPSVINNTSVTKFVFHWNYNHQLVAWSDWRDCGSSSRPANGNYNYVLKPISHGWIECF